MLSSAFLYNGVSIALGVTCVVSIALAFRSIPDKSPKKLFLIGLILILLTAILMPICLKIYKLAPVVATGEALGKVEKGTLEKILRFKDLATIGGVLELLAIILFAGVSKSLILQQVARQSEGEAPE